MVNSYQKGARGEREARDQVREHWDCPDCIRSAQAAGAFTADLLYGPHNFHLEVKRPKALAALRYMEQADRDKRDEEISVVLTRENKGTRWVVMFYMDDTEAFLESLNDCRRGA